MDIRTEQNRTELSSEALTDSIIFNLVKKISTRNKIYEEYQKSKAPTKNFGTPFYSYYPFIYLGVAVLFHLKVKPNLTFLFIHTSMTISIYQYDIYNVLRKMYPEQWEKYEHYSHCYREGIESRINEFSLLEYGQNCLQSSLTQEKVKNFWAMKIV